MLRGDIVKDNSGSYAVFTEQGSSASQMTAAKIMDIISRLPGCDGQAADAVSAYTQVKMEDVARKTYQRLLERRCGSNFIRFMDRIHEVHFIERKTSTWIFVVQGATYKKKTSNCQTLIVCCLKFGPASQKQLRSWRSRNGPLKNRSSIKLEHCEALISSIWKM